MASLRGHAHRRDRGGDGRTARRDPLALRRLKIGQAPIVIAVYATLAVTLGGQWIAAKLGVAAVPPLELSTMRFAIAAGVLLVACAITRTAIPLHRWRPIAAAAVCGVFTFNTLAFVGLSLTPASDSALIIPTTIPLATALFATAIHESLTSRKLVGFAIASLGAALVIAGGQQGGSESSPARLVGDLMELGAATAWAASLTIGAVVLRKETVLGYVTLVVVIGTALLLPLGALQQSYRDVPTWTTQTWLAASFLGVFSTSVAFVLFFWAVHRYGASLAAMGHLSHAGGHAVARVRDPGRAPAAAAARGRSRDRRRRAACLASFSPDRFGSGLDGYVPGHEVVVVERRITGDRARSRLLLDAEAI